MKDRYNDYEGYLFKYKYPYQWSLRNKNYLKKVFNRRPEIEYMTPPTDEHKVDACDRESEN